MIVIKGLDKPASCEECKLKYMGVCVPNTGRQFDKGNDGEWCPIVGEIPEHHGRLIDADVFCAVLQKAKESYTGETFKEASARMMADNAIILVTAAPTVFGAEE